HAEAARKDLAGYYAHIAALNDCVRDVTATLKECGIEKDTVLVLTSDHGDMLGSQGERKKQRPWDESIRVPLLVRHPAAHGEKGRKIDTPIDAPDLMPTLLGLCGVEIPGSVEGADFSALIRGAATPGDGAALITCVSPFGQWTRKEGGRECRGVRTRRYTYVRDLNGPWLLYDNEKDPYQLSNLCGKPEHTVLQDELERMLSRKLRETRDEFLPGPEYIKRRGYTVDENGTVPYTT
ncbi:MAG TPA: sulfatase/phosphatase domain-containing protein, partial [Sumerlaeia bacterium]|nr:sulfatase/phosphatase domain-containing protein [Sumerlaeia bacterium]